MKRLVTIFFFFALVYSSNAQTPPTPEAQALAQKLMSEINANIQCAAANITLNQQLTAAQAKIKALEDKYGPKKDVPK
jgi:hypothetical protein